MLVKCSIIPKDNELGSIKEVCECVSVRVCVSRRTPSTIKPYISSQGQRKYRRNI